MTLERTADLAGRTPYGFSKGFIVDRSAGILCRVGSEERTEYCRATANIADSTTISRVRAGEPRRIAGKRARRDRWIAVIVVECAALGDSEIVSEHTVAYGWIAVVTAIDGPSFVLVTVDYCEAANDGGGRFTRVEIESPVPLISRRLAIDDARTRATLAKQSNSLSFEIDVAVALSGVSPGTHYDHLTVAGYVYSSLDRWKIIRNI